MFPVVFYQDSQLERLCGKSNNLAPNCSKLSAMDLTAKVIFERLYVVSYWGTIGKICQHALCLHALTAQIAAISPFLCNLFPELPLIFFVSTIRADSHSRKVRTGTITPLGEDWRHSIVPFNFHHFFWSMLRKQTFSFKNKKKPARAGWPHLHLSVRPHYGRHWKMKKTESWGRFHLIIPEIGISSSEE